MLRLEVCITMLYEKLGTEPGTSCMLGKHSSHWAASPALTTLIKERSNLGMVAYPFDPITVEGRGRPL